MKVAELAEIVGGRVLGDAAKEIYHVNDLTNAGETDIAYVEQTKFLPAARESKAGCLLVPPGNDQQFSGRTVIEVANPKLAFSSIGAALHPPVRRDAKIHASAVIADSADVALTAYVGPFVEIGAGAHVGAFTRLEAGVVVGANVTIGDDCVLHSNVVLY